ncbi:MAG: hypothetical protein COB24_03160 [Hyphomicrobiales bacterium]|nr:MAG: hypothetical protein COB24_03160 [Hyphomicrobiales bacterium]
MHKFVRILVIALACGFGQNAYATWSRPEKLTDQVAIETLKNVRNLFFVTKGKVITCLKNGRSDRDCFCENKKNYIYLNKLADQMFEKYPSWDTALELRYIEGKTVKSIMPQELKRQMKFKENCLSYIFL